MARDPAPPTDPSQPFRAAADRVVRAARIGPREAAVALVDEVRRLGGAAAATLYQRSGDAPPRTVARVGDALDDAEEEPRVIALDESDGDAAWIVLDRATAPSDDAASLALSVFAATTWRAARGSSPSSPRVVAVDDEGRARRAEFVARVCHQVRTPLNGILGFAGLCLQEPLSARVKEQIRRIQTAGVELQTTLDHLAELQRVTSGDLAIVAAPFSLRAVFRGVLAKVHADAARKGISLTSSIAPNVPRQMVGDRERVEQVLACLVSNAVRFTHRGGVLLSASLADDGATSRALRIDVVDTGVGIGVDELARVFEPFGSRGRFEANAQGGTGIGLAIAAAVAGAMKGRVSAVSEPGVGSTFTLELTLVIGDDDGHASEHPSFAPGELPPRAELRVLVVEDNPVNQAVAVALLQREGHAVSVAPNGRAAVEAVRASPFDVVLMDLQMPEMDGYEATAQIRALDASRGARTPIIALTAHGATEDRRRCLAVGMDDFAVKPIDWPSLQHAIVRARGAGRCPTAPRPSHAPSGATLDEAALRARVGGRVEVLRRLLDVFREQYPTQVSELREAVARGDAAEARRVAHRLVGTLACFSASRAMDVVRDVEASLARGDLDTAAVRTAQVEAEVRAVDAAVAHVVRGEQGAAAREHA